MHSSWDAELLAVAGAQARFHALLTRTRILAEELRGLIVVVFVRDVADAARKVCDAASTHAHCGALRGVHRAAFRVTYEAHDIIVMPTSQER